MMRNHGSGLRVYYADDTFGGYVPPQAPRTPIDIAIRALEECATGDAGSAGATLAVVRQVARDALEKIQPERNQKTGPSSQKGARR